MRLFNRDKKNTDTADRNMLFKVPAQSGYAESFRTLRTNLFFSTVDKKVQSMVVTSALQSEGKTNTAANIACSLAQSGKKVVLVDSDLRRPFLTGLFNLKGQPGLTDLLVGTLDRQFTEGSLTDLSPADLIQLARFQNLTGILDLTSGQRQIRIWLKDGRIMDAGLQNSSEQPPLLSRLVTENLIPDATARTIRDIQQETGQDIRDILLGMGYLSRQDLGARLALQASEALKLASGMTGGGFKFSRMDFDAMGIGVLAKVEMAPPGQDLLSRPEDLEYINAAIDDAVHDTPVPNLRVLGAGSIPPNPSELIASERTALILACLKQKYDFTIVDIAPVVPASDAMLMAPRTDGILLVVRAGYANKKLVRQVMDQFRQSNLTILGAVLNRVKPGRQGYYYGEYHSD